MRLKSPPAIEPPLIELAPAAKSSDPPLLMVRLGICKAMFDTSEPDAVEVRRNRSRRVIPHPTPSGVEHLVQTMQAQGRTT